MAAYVSSPHEVPPASDGTKMRQGRAIAAKCGRWMEGHRGEFLDMLSYVYRLRESGERGRICHKVADMCVKRGIDVSDGEHAFDNTLWAGISRYMALVDPTLVGDPLGFRESALDHSGLLAVSWLGIKEEDDG